MTVRFPDRLCVAVAALALLSPSLTRGQAPGTQAPGTQAAGAAAAGGSEFTIRDVLDVASWTVADLSDDGRWAAVTAGTRRDGIGVDFRRDGDPSYIRPARQTLWSLDTRTGERRQVWAEKRNVRSVRWSPDGSRLAVLVVEGESIVPVIWERATARVTRVAVPAGQYVAENSEVRWWPDGSRLVLALRPVAWRDSVRREFARMTEGPVFVQSSEDPFLTWDALRRRGSLRSVAAYELATRQTKELVPLAMISSYAISEDGKVVTYQEDVTKKTDYDVIFGTENKLVAKPVDGAPRTLLPSLKQTTLVWAQDGRRYAYGKEGKVWVATVDDTAARQVAGPAGAAPRGEAAAADTSAEAREKREKERFSPLRFSPKGDALIVSNKEGLWLLDVASGAKEMFLETDSSRTAPQRSVIGWTEDGNTIFLSYASRTKWERGLLRYDRATKRLEEVVKDGRSYSGIRFAKDGRTAVLNIAQGNRPADLYVADGDLRSPRRLVETNPHLAARRFGKTELLSYLDADGHQKFGVVYYPADYQPGKAYPTVFNIYEEFFDDTFDGSINLLTAKGYVVVRPSVDFDIGYPGEAWVKGVTSAANKLIEMGVADSARLGVHGTSYGGYATNLLITQTQRFKAAINVSGKVDVISFYTDSPRLGVRNIHAAEKSQDRLGATLWQQPQKYVAHSAIMFADRIKTPLLLMTGELDSNVPAGNTREMYYALRRLGKEVVWVNYMNGGHGTPLSSVEDFTDWHRRIVEWYDAKLKGDGKKKSVAANTAEARP